MNYNYTSNNHKAIILGFILVIIIFSGLNEIKYVKAQHHGAPPPFATIGDRKIIMNFVTSPSPLISNQNAELRMHLTDQNSNKTIEHVTYRITILHDNTTKMSNFFHSHSGELTIAVKNPKAKEVNVEGTFDDLTNAIVPDFAGVIVITGPLFSSPGHYKAEVEIITIDNDKTDLSNPLKYSFDINTK